MISLLKFVARMFFPMVKSPICVSSYVRDIQPIQVILRRLTGFPIGRWFVKPGRGSILTKRAKTNREYIFLHLESQVFTCVSKTKVGSIFFGFLVFVLSVRIVL